MPLQDTDPTPSLGGFGFRLLERRRQLEELDVDGLFWLATVPDDKVAGRLSFNDESGAELDLIGAFSGVADFTELSGEPVRIQGVADAKRITLDECFQVGKSMTMPGFVREKYRVTSVLVGAHFDYGELLKFNSLQLQMEHLRAWVDKSGTQVSITSDDASKRIERIQITHEALEMVTGSSYIGELAIHFPWSFHPNNSGKTSITQGCLFGVQFANRLALEEIVQACFSVRDLVTIAVDVPTTISDITLYPTREERVKLHIRNGGQRPQAKANSDVHPAQMLFTFDDIGGLRGIASWLKYSERYETVISSLMGNWYLPGLYSDLRFLNAAIAAEALERIKTQKQILDFRRALLSLAKQAGDTFHALVNGIESWSREITQIRVNQVVHRGLGGDIDWSRLYDLTESLYYLVVLCLLKECGVPERAFSRVSQNGRFIELAKRLRCV